MHGDRWIEPAELHQGDAPAERQRVRGRVHGLMAARRSPVHDVPAELLANERPDEDDPSTLRQYQARMDPSWHDPHECDEDPRSLFASPEEFRRARRFRSYD